LTTADVQRFLDSTYEEVPAGCELSPDLDLELASLPREG
jgi:hypothetical protein